MSSVTLVHPWTESDAMWQGHSRAPQIHLLFPQIQKLADRSDVISEVQKCSKIQIFQGSTPDSAGGAPY